MNQSIKAKITRPSTRNAATGGGIRLSPPSLVLRICSVTLIGVLDAASRRAHLLGKNIDADGRLDSLDLIVSKLAHILYTMTPIETLSICSLVEGGLSIESGAPEILNRTSSDTF